MDAIGAACRAPVGAQPAESFGLDVAHRQRIADSRIACRLRVFRSDVPEAGSRRAVWQRQVQTDFEPLHSHLRLPSNRVAVCQRPIGN